MSGITVPMAIVDFIPVVLFFLAAVVLQRDLYNKMVKGAFALLAAGSILVLIGGVYKALWKILYALAICDYAALDTAFFPMQAPGFLLVFISLVAMLTRKNKNAAPLAAAVPLYESNVPFIAMETLGSAGVQVCLMLLARRMKKPLALVMFVISLVFMLAMGYLGAKFDDTSGMHWLAQVTNIVSQSALLIGVCILHKAGLGAPDALQKGGNA